VTKPYVVSFHGTVVVSACDEWDAFEKAEEEIQKGWADIDYDEAECQEYDPNDPRI